MRREIINSGEIIAEDDSLEGGPGFHESQP